MTYIRVKKSPPLKGTVMIDGSKNAALPILAASLLGTEDIILEDVPRLKDIEIMIQVLETLGATTEYLDANTVKINSSDLKKYETPFELMDKMRASFLVMGPLLARLGKTLTSLPGGCNIGDRPIDLHLKGFRTLGASVDDATSHIGASAENGLKGDVIYLDFPSVGATQNIMMAATMAEGTTIIENAAREPEIVDLSSFLAKMGADIKGAGTSTIRIRGVSKLGGASHTIIPDRIEASTFMLAAAITKGDVVVENVLSDHIRPVIAKLVEAGCDVSKVSEDSLRVTVPADLKSTNIRTLPYPGFPTDVQAPFMALMTICGDESKVEETVFENRFLHVRELVKMGALIVTEGNEARIRGVPGLRGASVKATDLRGGAALVLAGLVAEGESRVYDVYHIDRGYSNFEEKLRALGGIVERVEE